MRKNLPNRVAGEVALPGPDTTRRTGSAFARGYGPTRPYRAVPVSSTGRPWKGRRIMVGDRGLLQEGHPLRFEPVIGERSLHDAIGAHPPATLAGTAGQMHRIGIAPQTQQIAPPRSW